MSDKARRLHDKYDKHHDRFDDLIKLRLEPGEQNTGIHTLNN